LKEGIDNKKISSSFAATSGSSKISNNIDIQGCGINGNVSGHK
jgi:hypothetical protein